MVRDSSLVLPQHSQDLASGEEQLGSECVSTLPISLPLRPECPSELSRPSRSRYTYSPLRVLTLVPFLLIAMAGVIVSAIALGRVIQTQYFREGLEVDYTTQTSLSDSAFASVASAPTRTGAGAGLGVRTVEVVLTRTDVAQHATSSRSHSVTSPARL